MNSQNTDQFTCQDGQIFFDEQCQTSNCAFLLPQTDILINYQSSIIDKSSPFDNAIHQKAYKSKFDEESEDAFAKKAISKKKTKKRNSQNSVRTIVRTLRPVILKYWTVQINKLFQSQKLINLIAIFRKASQCQLLDEIKNTLETEFEAQLTTSYEQKDKDLKLQLYLKSILLIKNEDLKDEPGIRKILGQKNFQFKKHPLKVTLAQILQIQDKIISKN